MHATTVEVFVKKNVDIDSPKSSSCAQKILITLFTITIFRFPDILSYIVKILYYV